MQTYQLKDLFTLLQSKISNKFKIGVFLIPLFFSQKTQANLNIAIIDTGFCSHQNTKNISFKPFIDLTHSISKLDCPKNYENLPRFHGELVLSTFLKQLKSDKKISIYPMIVFDNEGKQKIDYWEQALIEIEKNQIDLVLTASGIKLNKGEKIEFKNSKAIWYVSAARVSPGIEKSDQVFPQLVNNSKIFQFGIYDDQNFIDLGLLNVERISLFIKNTNLKFNGTSYALPMISAEIISKCDELVLTKKCEEKLSESIKKIDSLKR